jgi:hypothetical protein
MNRHPPVTAQWVLSAVLPAGTRDSVLGDLLEEYRESQLPSRGSLRSDWWYVRQAAGFFWRASRWWALAVGALLGTRAILDTVVPTFDHFHTRAAVTTYLAMTFFVALGMYAGRRTRRFPGAALIAVVAAVIGCAMCLIVPAAITMLLSVGLLRSVASYAGLREAFDMPVLPMAIVGAVLALCGATIGTLTSRMRRPAGTLRPRI